MSDGIVAERIRRVLNEALAPHCARHRGRVAQAREPCASPIPARRGDRDGETHFKIKVVSDGFRGKSRLERHRAINALLADELGVDKVHALAIEARAPGE